MGMFLFITGVTLMLGGLAFGLPLMMRGDLTTGAALGIMIPAGPAAGRQLVIKPNIQITIGRADDNFLAIPDPEVSSRHCVMNCANDRIDFQDLGSSNGSFLDGTPFRQGNIRSGQTLQLGR